MQTGTDGADIRYAIDGVISSTDDQKQVLGEMDFAWQGNAYEIDGSLVFRPGIDIPNSEAKRLSVDDTLVEFLGAQPGPALADRLNAVTMRIAQSSNDDFLPHDLSEIRDEANITRDGRKYLKDLGTKRFVASPWNAERLMAIAIRRARNTAVYTYRFAPGDDFANISILPGQMVLLSDRIRGISGTRMLVIHQSLNTDWSVTLTMVEQPTGTFASDARVLPQKPRKFTFTERAPGAVRELTLTGIATIADDGTAVYRVNVTWAGSVFKTVLDISGPNSFRDGRDASGTRATFVVPEPGDYTVMARHRNASSVDGPIATAMVTVDTAPLTPAAPEFEALRQNGGRGQLDIVSQSPPRPRQYRDTLQLHPGHSGDASRGDGQHMGGGDPAGALPPRVWRGNRSHDGGIPDPGVGRLQAGGTALQPQRAGVGDRRPRSARAVVAGDTGHGGAPGQALPPTPLTIWSRIWVAVGLPPPLTPIPRRQIQAWSGIPSLRLPAARWTGFDWRGDWVVTTSYVVNDVVQHEGSTWIATADNVGSEPDGSSTDWDLFAERGEPGDDGSGFDWEGAWDETTAYQPNDIVSYQKTAWLAVEANTASVPGADGGTDWVPFCRRRRRRRGSQLARKVEQDDRLRHQRRRAARRRILGGGAGKHRSGADAGGRDGGGSIRCNAHHRHWRDGRSLHPHRVLGLTLTS